MLDQGKIAPNISNNTFDTIKALRFPLMVGIVFIHSLILPKGNFVCYDFFFSFITMNLASVCVPLFFFFSGYLFYNGLQQFDVDLFKSKLKRRAMSLFLPYLLWNAFVLFVIFIAQLAIPSLATGAFPYLGSISFKEFLLMFYDANGSTQPICFQFWFLRDLMIMIIISPILWLFLRYFREVFVALCFIAYIAQIKIPIVGLSFLGLFFFSFGAYFSVFTKKFIITSRVSVILLFSWLVVCLFLSFRSGESETPHRINIVMGSIAVSGCMSWILNVSFKLKVLLCKLSETSFFLYAAHGVIIQLLVRLSVSHIYNDFSAVLTYFLSVVVTVFLSLVFYQTLKKAVPRFLIVLTGGRV